MSYYQYMARSKRQETFGYEPDSMLALRQMNDLVYALNATRIRRSLATKQDEIPANRKAKMRFVRLPLSQTQQELRMLVERWKASGPNLVKLFKSDPDLGGRLKFGQVTLHPMPDGRGYLEMSEAAAQNPAAQALQIFQTLITNPQWKLLQGPCPRCKNYFVLNTSRRRVYCSRLCGSETTAVLKTKEARARKHQKKLDHAAGTIKEWKRLKPRTPWKSWVASETGYSIWWIGRAANKGHLHPPHG